MDVPFKHVYFRSISSQRNLAFYQNVSSLECKESQFPLAQNLTKNHRLKWEKKHR